MWEHTDSYKPLEHALQVHLDYEWHCHTAGLNLTLHMMRGCHLQAHTLHKWTLYLDSFGSYMMYHSLLHYNYPNVVLQVLHLWWIQPPKAAGNSLFMNWVPGQCQHGHCIKQRHFVTVFSEIKSLVAISEQSFYETSVSRPWWYPDASVTKLLSCSQECETSYSFLNFPKSIGWAGQYFSLLWCHSPVNRKLKYTEDLTRHPGYCTTVGGWQKLYVFEIMWLFL